jgi:hypothetical protein
LFLQNKYSEGQFNKAVRDGYDDSIRRLDAKIAYTYRVYFDRAVDSNNNDLYAAQRTNMKYIISDEVVNNKTGDSYYYHLPIYSFDAKSYKIDFDNEVIDKATLSVSGPIGLLSSLNFLANAIKNSNNPNMPRDVFENLQQYNIINERDELTFQPQGCLVEKYFKAFGNENKRQEAIDHLVSTNLGVDEFKKNEKNEKATGKKAEEAPVITITSIEDLKETIKISDTPIDSLSQLITACSKRNDVELKIITELKTPDRKNSDYRSIEFPIIRKVNKTVNDKHDVMIYIFYFILKKGTTQQTINTAVKLADPIRNAFYKLTKEGLIKTDINSWQLHKLLNTKGLTLYKNFDAKVDLKEFKVDIY